MMIDATMFGDDVYINTDKKALKELISILGLTKVTRRLGLHKDTVGLWYRRKNRTLPVGALRKICRWAGKDLRDFEVSYLGGRGLKSNRLVPFLNKSLAYLVGVIVGDGHLYDYRVHIASDEITLEKAIIPCVQSLGFQYIVRAQEWKGNSWKTLEINSRPLVWFLRDIFQIPVGKKATIVRIPSPIKAADVTIKTAFLRGLFDTDGSIERRRRCISFCTTSIQLFNDVTQFLNGFGICISCRADKRRKNPVYHLAICRLESVRIFSEFVGFENPEKKRRLDRALLGFS